MPFICSTNNGFYEMGSSETGEIILLSLEDLRLRKETVNHNIIFMILTIAELSLRGLNSC